MELLMREYVRCWNDIILLLVYPQDILSSLCCSCCIGCSAVLNLAAELGPRTPHRVLCCLLLFPFSLGSAVRAFGNATAGNNKPAQRIDGKICDFLLEVFFS